MAREWDSCISRAYYACYHCVAAVIEAKIGFTRRRWDHKPLLEDFRQYFSRKGFFFRPSDADDFDVLMALRFSADYDDSGLNNVKARDALEKAKELCDKIREVLSEKNK